MRRPELPELVVVVGSGGVGKTTVAAALALGSASEGESTLVLTFDPARRLREALGVGVAAAGSPVAVPGAARLHAGLLDAKRTFDALVGEYAPDEAARRRILENRYYRELAGSLSGVLDYMGVERLYEVAREARFDRIVLDTPPTTQALDLLAAPDRIVSFLDSTALQLALRPWFDERGRLRPTSRLGAVGRKLEEWLDGAVGLELLRDIVEFCQAFTPLYEGFRERAAAVRELLVSPTTGFLLVSDAEPERVPDALHFARQLVMREHRLLGVVANGILPLPPREATYGSATHDGRQLLAWRARRQRAGLGELESRLAAAAPLITLPRLEQAPTGIERLRGLAERLLRGWHGGSAAASPASRS